MERIVNDLSVRIERLEGIVESSSKDLSEITEKVKYLKEEISNMCKCENCKCVKCDCTNCK